METNRDLGAILTFHRKQAGLSRNSLAEIAGVGKTAVFDLEHGKISVQFDTILKILKVLNIQLDFRSPLMDLFRKESRAQS